MLEVRGDLLSWEEIGFCINFLVFWLNRIYDSIYFREWLWGVNDGVFMKIIVYIYIGVIEIYLFIIGI